MLHGDRGQSAAEAHSTASLSLRYDVAPSSDVKIQFDHWKNHAQPAFFLAVPNTADLVEQANLLTLAYDKVF